MSSRTFITEHGAMPRSSMPAPYINWRNAVLKNALFQAAVLSLVATLAVMMIPDWSSSDYFTVERVFVLGFLQFACLLLPVWSCLTAYSMHRDLFYPYIVASMTFAVFHVLLNPIVIYGLREMPEITQIGIGRHLGPSFSLYTAAVRSYVVLIVSWIAFLVGYRLLPNRVQSLKIRGTSQKTTELFIVFGLVFVLIGMAANIGVMGSVSGYMEKMIHFYSRSSEWIDANLSGGMKWTIMMKFLPVGLIVLAIGAWLRNGVSSKRFVVYLMMASVANVILNCSTGGRGRSLTVLFFSIILINEYVRRFTLKRLLCYFLSIVVVSFVLGMMRGISHYGTFDQVTLMELLTEGGRAGDFVIKYLTNTMGTLVLTDETVASGIIHGKTAFAGLTGLLGGATPLTTQQEVFQRLMGELTIGNPRFGPPGELYFNYGVPGVVVGFVVIGFLVSFFSRAYLKSRGDPSLYSALVIVYTAFTVNFLMIANLNYIPPYFTFYSIPFYAAFVVFRRRRC